MCDICSAVFSVRDPGWQTLMATQTNPETGQRTSTQLDLCGKCSFGSAVPKPLTVGSA